MLMALDVGSKRIGIAVADPGGTFALPVATLERSSRRADLHAINEYLVSYGVDELVVGDPITLRGERGIAAQTIDAFVEELRETISVLENQATLSSIGVGLNNREVIFLRIRLHGGGLKR